MPLKVFLCLNVKAMREHFMGYRQHLLTLEEGKGKEVKHKIKRMEAIFVNESKLVAVVHIETFYSNVSVSLIL